MNATVLLLTLAVGLSGCFALGCNDHCDPYRPFVVVVPDDILGPVWIRWEATAPGEGHDLVALALHNATSSYENYTSPTWLTERQAALVSAFLKGEWTRAGGDPDQGSFELAYADERWRVGVDWG